MFDFSCKYFNYGLENERLYNLKDVLANFSSYLGISLVELKELFNNYSIIDYETIKDYIYKNNSKIFELSHDGKIFVDDVIKNRYVDYEYFKKNLAILSNKGLRYIELLEYMGNMNSDVERDDNLEDVIDELGIFHYGSILKGIDINRLINKISIIVTKFNEFLEKVNSFDTYNMQNIDHFALVMGGDSLYPDTSLVVMDEYNTDKTSFSYYETNYSKKKKRGFGKYN